MAKETAITMTGTVTDVLPGAAFIVQLENGCKARGHLSGKIKMHFIKVIPGDKVIIELSPYDLTRGRIIRRELKGALKEPVED